MRKNNVNVSYTVVIRCLRPKFKFPAKIEMAFFVSFLFYYNCTWNKPLVFTVVFSFFKDFLQALQILKQCFKQTSRRLVIAIYYMSSLDLYQDFETTGWEEGAYQSGSSGWVFNFNSNNLERDLIFILKVFA